jgi:hypothetical protein|tara:strand:+ start:70 stop:378 length:309 start_codon:yes stop_codon:yes gene_type:complete
MKYKIKEKGSPIMSIKLPEKFEKIVTNSKQEWLDTRGMTRDELRTLIEGRVIRDQEVSPKVGEDAPDFDVEILDAQGKRTDKMMKLSSQFGVPIGLVFGSYT